MKTDSGKKLDIDSYMVKELAPFSKSFSGTFSIQARLLCCSYMHFCKQFCYVLKRVKNIYVFKSVSIKPARGVRDILSLEDFILSY